MLVLARWRDAAFILLAFELFVIGLPIGVAFYYGLRGLRQAQAWLAPRLRIARGYARQGRDTGVRITSALAGPFVLAQSVLAGVRRALQALGGR